MTKKKILLVDDEQEIVELVTLRLQKYGYTVIPAYDGESALKKAKIEQPDLIILDLMLPQIDGYMVCSLLKKDVRYKKTPIILFSARSQDEDKALGKRVGADAYIMKGDFEQKNLIETVKSLIR